MQQTDPEVGGQLGEMPCILVHALVGIDADVARIGEAKGADRHQPVLHQIVHETLAELEFQHLAQPALRHVQHQQRARDDAENAQLLHELGKVPVRQGIIERLIPAIETNLPEGGGRDDDEQRDCEKHEHGAGGGGPQRPGHHGQLRNQPRFSNLVFIGERSDDVVRPVCHHGWALSGAKQLHHYP